MTRIQIALPVFIVKILHEPTDDFERPLVGNAQVRTEILLPQADDFSPGPIEAGRNKLAQRNLKDEVGVRTEAEPEIALAGRTDADEIAPFSKQISDDLKMEVRRPAAVFGDTPNSAHDISFFYRLALPHVGQGIFCKMSIESIKCQLL